MSSTTNTFVLVSVVSVFLYVGTVINSASSSCLAEDGDFEACFEAMAQKMDWFAFSSVILGVSVIAYMFHPESKTEVAEEGDAGTPPPLERTRLPSYDDNGNGGGDDDNLASPALGFRRSNSNSSLDYLLVGSASSGDVVRSSPDNVNRSREVELEGNSSYNSNSSNSSNGNNKDISSSSSSSNSSNSNNKDISSSSSSSSSSNKDTHKDSAYNRLEQIRQNWKVYDKIYGVIPQETYELWRNNETSKQKDSISSKSTFESSNIDSSSCSISSNDYAAKKVPPIRYRQNS